MKNFYKLQKSIQYFVFKRTILFYIVLFFSLLTTNLNAINTEWKIYNADVGVDIILDDGNYIWTGGLNGLQRFNKITNETITYNRANSVLPHNFIRAIEKDSTGNIWIGTSGGLVKYDAYEMTYIPFDYGAMPNNAIYSIACDSTGNIWCGNNYGLAVYNQIKWTYYRKDIITQFKNGIQTIAYQNPGVIWIGTDGYGLIKFNGKEWEFFTKPDYGVPSYSITNLIIDKKGKLFINFITNSDDVIVQYDGTNWSIINDNPIQYISKMRIDKYNNIWTCGYKGIAKYDGVKWTNYDINSGLPSNSINEVAIDRNDNIWFSVNWNVFSSDTNSGLFKFDGKELSRYDLSNSKLPNNFINRIYIDDDNNKWIFTNKCLVKFDGANWTNYSIKDKNLPTNTIDNLVIDKNKLIWFSSGQNLKGPGLIKYDGKDYTDFNTSNSELQSNIIICMAVDSSNILWIGSSAGLSKFDGKNIYTYDPVWYGSDLSHNSISDLVVDKKNNLWFFTSDKLIQFDGTNLKNYKISDILKKEIKSLKCLAIDSSNHLWIGTNVYNNNDSLRSLIEFDGSSFIWHEFYIPEFPYDNYLGITINSLVIDKENRKWAAYDYQGSFQGGLLKFDGNWQQFNISNSPEPGQGVFSLAVDKNNNKWIGTEAGLAVYQKGGVIFENVEENSVISEKNTFSLFPNPTYSGHEITLQIPENISGIKLSLYNSLGSLLDTHVESDVSPGQRTIKYKPRVELSSGTYWIRVETGRESWCKPVVIIDN